MSRHKLCLVGDFFNLGDAFLAETQARYLAARENGTQVTVAPYQAPPEGMVAHFERLRLGVLPMRTRPVVFLLACARSDIFIGGGHAVREAISVGWLLLALAGSLLARMFGHSVLLVGAGVTPVKHRLKQRLWRALLRQCRALSVRDAQSAAHLAELAPSLRARVRVSNDVAFLAGTELQPAARGARRIGLVSPAIDAGEARDVDLHRIVDLVGLLHRRGWIDELRVLAHDIRPQFDGDVCERLAERVWRELNVPARVANGSIGSRLVDNYRSASLIVTGRLHGLIAGALLRRPVLYTGEAARKLSPFGERFGFPCVRLDIEDWTADVERALEGIARLDAASTEAQLENARREACVNFD
jgi:polysaccharide pyruvyl transferase WcaK-like protein